MKIKMDKKRGIIFFVLSLAVMVFAGYVIMFGIGDRGKAEYITQGLDLKGGVSITYQVAKEDRAKLDSSSLEATRGKLEKRVHNFSTEATAYKQGDDRITVDIPGAYDAQKVLDELGKPGSLYFCTKADSTPTEEQLKNKEYIQLKKTTNSQFDGYYKVWLTGEHVSDAVGQAETDSKTGKHQNVVNLKFDSEGTKAFGDMTSQNVNKTSYIIYDNEVLSYPTINQAITGGQAQITGGFDLKEAETLASNIKIGALDLSLEELSHNVQSATLGRDALSKSIQAGIIGFIIIAIFMLLVYRIPGIAAALALFSYLELMLLALNGFDLTLTLPGIAGIILNIGMAVDANVIIYARIREEIAAGKTVKSAIKIGFDKATSAIVDGNITTLIAALVLLWRGSGTVKGFAMTLAIGIFIQLFSSLVISRGLVWMLYYMGFQKPGFYGKEQTKKIFKFVEKKVIWFTISIVVIVVGIGSIIFNVAKGNDAFNYSIEFKGGTSISVQFDKAYSIDEFNDEIKPVIEKMLNTTDVLGQKDTSNDKLYTIKTRNMSEKEMKEFKSTLIDKFKATDNKENFNDNKISDTISSEMRTDAVIATIIAIICMLIYIWIRFKNIHFALAAVLALVHDVIIVVGAYSLTRLTVGTTFIAVMLTIIGYSINATIVIFDRIRENKALMKREDTMIGVVDASISQTLTRSIYTSLTTFISVFVIFIMGVSSIREFTLPLMVGIVAGAFSSVFITGSLWYILKGKKYDLKKNK